jgi:acyl-CoA hydrolase
MPAAAPDASQQRIIPASSEQAVFLVGAGVTTGRNDVHCIATEYGIVDLWGRSIAERVQALVSIAHPDFRDDLLAYAREQNYIGKVYAVGSSL